MSRARFVVLVTVLVVVSLGFPALAQVGGDATITDVTYTADGSIGDDDGRLELWHTTAHAFTATADTGGRFEGELCLVATDDQGPTTLACKSTTIGANTTVNRTVGIGGLPSNVTGAQEITLALRTDGSAVATSDPLAVTVIEKSGDIDDDGLSNERELSVGSGMGQGDSDGDGLTDGQEVGTHETSPTNADSDGDGLSDRAEVETYQTNPLAADTDGDGLPDDREVMAGTNPNEADSDGDGLDDAVEVNTYETNATQADSDGDSLADGAELEDHASNPADQDTDDDGLGDALEVNTYGTGPNTVDTDGDGLDDGVEVNDHQTGPTKADSDGDGLTDGQEVNTYDSNPTSADTDGDGLGDGAEVDHHGTDPTMVDSDGDGQSDRAEVNPQPLGTVPIPVVVLGMLATVMSVAGGVLYHSDREFAATLPRLRSQPAADPPIETQTAPSGPEETSAQGKSVPPEFLSNEDRIQQLLSEEDGRMRQADIVDETGWSKSKVSRVLSTMAEQDDVVKVDVGKGNVITLPDRVPPGAQSPFDEVSE